jgi:hypothetical protein
MGLGLNDVRQVGKLSRAFLSSIQSTLVSFCDAHHADALHAKQRDLMLWPGLPTGTHRRPKVSSKAMDLCWETFGQGSVSGSGDPATTGCWQYRFCRSPRDASLPLRCSPYFYFHSFRSFAASRAVCRPNVLPRNEHLDRNPKRKRGLCMCTHSFSPRLRFGLPR